MAIHFAFKIYCEPGDIVRLARSVKNQAIVIVPKNNDRTLTDNAILDAPLANRRPSNCSRTRWKFDWGES